MKVSESVCVLCVCVPTQTRVSCLIPLLNQPASRRGQIVCQHYDWGSYITVLTEVRLGLKLPQLSLLDIPVM